MIHLKFYLRARVKPAAGVSDRRFECPDSLALQVVKLLSCVHEPVYTGINLGTSVPEVDIHILPHTGTHMLTCSPQHLRPFVHSV